MKKLIKYILPSLVLTGFFVSCGDELDKLPPQSLSTELALSNEDNVLGVLIGSYSALSNGDLFGGEILRNSELLAADNEIVFTGTASSTVNTTLACVVMKPFPGWGPRSAARTDLFRFLGYRTGEGGS